MGQFEYSQENTGLDRKQGLEPISNCVRIRKRAQVLGALVFHATGFEYYSVFLNIFLLLSFYFNQNHNLVFTLSKGNLLGRIYQTQFKSCSL